MGWFKRLEGWQKLWMLLSVVSFAAIGWATASAYPQANAKLIGQLTSAECAVVRSLPSSEINPDGLRKEQYALYRQCGDLFWYRVRHRDAAATLENYQDRLKNAQVMLMGQATLVWFGISVTLYVLLFAIVRLFRWARPDTETTEPTEPLQ
ncbi:MAG: hypothetical protein ACE5K1_09580 [Acidiferrobacterales bacterium]